MKKYNLIFLFFFILLVSGCASFSGIHKGDQVAMKPVIDTEKVVGIEKPKAEGTAQVAGAGQIAFKAENKTDQSQTKSGRDIISNETKLIIGIVAIFCIMFVVYAVCSEIRFYMIMRQNQNIIDSFENVILREMEDNRKKE